MIFLWDALRCVRPQGDGRPRDDHLWEPGLLLADRVVVVFLSRSFLEPAADSFDPPPAPLGSAPPLRRRPSHRSMSPAFPSCLKTEPRARAGAC